MGQPSKEDAWMGKKRLTIYVEYDERSGATSTHFVGSDEHNGSDLLDATLHALSKLPSVLASGSIEWLHSVTTEGDTPS